MQQKEDKAKIVDPSAVTLAALFDKALAAENKTPFQQAFVKLYAWALNKLTLPRIPNEADARELVQGALIAVYKKSEREAAQEKPLEGAAFPRIVYTHLLGSQEAGILGAITKYLKSKSKTISLDETIFSAADEGTPKKNMIPDNELDDALTHKKSNRSELQKMSLPHNLCNPKKGVLNYEQPVKIRISPGSSISLRWRHQTAKASHAR